MQQASPIPPSPAAVAAALDYAPRRASSPPSSWSLGRLRTDRWTSAHLALATLMGALGVAATFEAWKDIAHLAYREPEYSHIFLVPLVAAWMVFVRRLRFRHCRPTGTGVGVLAALAGWGISAFGFYHGYQTLWHAGAVLVVVGCVLSVLGKQAFFRFFPAVAVLVFLIPVPPHYRLRIAVPLQGWTAQISQTVLEMFSVQVERSANRLSVNGRDVSIIEACNGLRMVFALILVSYAFSFGLPLRNSVRFVVLLASPISAIFCNVVRIIPTVCLFAYFPARGGARQGIGDVFHEWSGWLMLPVSFVLLLGIIKTLRWAMLPVMKYTLAS